MSKVQTNGDGEPNPKEVRAKLGTNIKKIRTASNLQQMKLACDAEVDLSTISSLENSKADCSISTLARIKKALNATWDDLLSGV
jgi:transcriptional regulator with XRE-family HTH domain